MNRQQFANWLINQCDCNSEESKSSLIAKYTNGLLNNLDFDKLQCHLIIEKLGSLPSPKELNDIAQAKGFTNVVATNPCQCEALRHMAEIQATPRVEMKDFPDELKAKILKFTRRFGIKSCLEEL
jgi:hypothetical protein